MLRSRQAKASANGAIKLPPMPRPSPTFTPPPLADVSGSPYACRKGLKSILGDIIKAVPNFEGVDGSRVHSVRLKAAHGGLDVYLRSTTFFNRLSVEGLPLSFRLLPQQTQASC